MDLMHSSLSIVSGGLWWSPGGSGCRKRRVNWNGWIRIGSGRGPSMTMLPVVVPMEVSDCIRSRRCRCRGSAQCESWIGSSQCGSRD